MPNRSLPSAVRASRAAARRSVATLASSVLVLALAVGALLAATPAASSAQGVATVTTNAPWLKTGTNPCVNAEQRGPAAVAVSNCTGWSEYVHPCFGAAPGTCAYIPAPNAPVVGVSDVRASASAVNGQLRVSAASHVVSTSGDAATVAGMGLGWRAYATAQWNDVLRLAPDLAVRPAKVVFDVWYHGDQAVRSAGGLAYDGPVVCHGPLEECNDPPAWMTQGGVNTLSNFRFSAGDVTTVVDTTFAVVSEPGEWNTLHRASEQALHWTKTREIGSTTTAIGFSYFLRADANVFGGILDNQHAIVAKAHADYGNTAGLRGVRFLDAQGNDITGQVSYTFDRGTQFLPQTTTAPEPASLALCATGLLLIGGIARRRQHVMG